MITIGNLLNMVCSEAIDGGVHRDHYFDESRNAEPVLPERTYPSKTNNLPPIRYNLELIRRPDGSLEWVE